MHRAFLGTARDPGGDSRREGFVNLTRLDPDGRLLPVKDLQRCINHVMAERGSELLRYGKAAGYAPLREYIATRLRVHGVAASPANVLITNGAQEGLDLVFRLLGGPGRRAALEAPTYFTVLPLLRFLGVELEGIPMAEGGMNLDRLEEALRKRRIDFVYTIPNFQNPTGITTSQEHRERLLGICERRRTPLVEDGFEEDMKYFGKAVLPIKSMDRRQVVIYVGTFSKVLFPGVRIGWITGDEACIERLTALKRFTDLGTGTFIQAVLDRFCRDGCYDVHLKRLHRIYRRRMQTALDAMDRHLPAGVEWTRPAGGYTIWIKTGARGGEARLRELMDRHRVLVSLGRLFFPDDRRTDYVRISIADVDEKEISEGIERLGALLGDLRVAKGAR
jgi:DNA-binding transcriptional MocR family regulator